MTRTISWLGSFLITAMSNSLVRFVDMYGDTVFNQLQLPQLFKELRSLVKRPFDAAVHSHLAALTGLVQEASGQVHSYIRFHGD